jgi:integrase
MTPGQIINGLSQGSFAVLGKVNPSGSLEARRLAAGVQFYWRYTLDGKTDRVPIGPYDSGAPPKSIKPTDRGYSVQAAIRAAEDLAHRHRATIDMGGHRAAAQAAKQAKEDARLYTLDAMLTDYCDHLETLGRTAHKDARSIFKLHIREAWPAVAKQPAATVTSEQFADMMRTLIEAGKGRTANKLRSYARAAFAMAKAARTKPTIPLRFKAYGITSNPVADTEPDEGANKPDKNPLTADELRIYWQAIKGMDGIRGAALRLHLLTGGQRIEQLVNLRTANIAAGSILLHDGKGRPGRPPRPHAVPLTKAAKHALAECKPSREFALSTDGGETHLAATTLAAWAVEAAKETLPDFQAKRVRSGVETLLASARVPQEIRGRLQSHGISGVQARHYDGHDYAPEELRALETLEKLLNAKK